MIHYVIKEVDEGAPLLVKELPMIEGESVQDLESRMHDLGQ
jgi:phosphoribosylglycinamide formyltransferase